MKMRDAVKVVGELTLADFPWGQRIVDYTNDFLEEAEVSLATTGVELLAEIGKLPVEKQETLLALSLKIRKPEAKPVKKAKKKHAGLIESLVKNPRLLMLMLVLTASVVIAFLVILAVNAAAVKNGGAPDQGLIDAVFKFLIELVKAFTGAGANPTPAM